MSSASTGSQSGSARRQAWRGARWVPGWLVLAALLAPGAQAPAETAPTKFEAARRAMVREVRTQAEGNAFEVGHSGIAGPVLEAMLRVPRHEFVPESERDDAYENRPLPIGYGQTISQPYIVALMTDLLQAAPGHRVLEVGTGSGYQAAVLAELGVRVYSVEIIAALAQPAAARLQRLGYDQVEVRVADGYYGWEEHAPYDGIVVTAAAASIPPALIAQLKPGGRLVIPVGGAFYTQMLMLVEKREDGKVRNRQILPVRFVPLTGEH